MKNYSSENPWPSKVSWVNPSPNAPNIMMARAFPGTVMLEGTHLSEGRGTTRPLEVMGSADIDHQKVLNEMNRLAPEWLKGCKLRICYFEPTFHKYEKQLCHGIQIHTDGTFFDEKLFKPYRLVALYFKSIRKLYPDFEIWKNFPYEYEYDRLAIDLINGSELLRQWVDSHSSSVQEFDSLCRIDEEAWKASSKNFFLYP